MPQSHMVERENYILTPQVVPDLQHTERGWRISTRERSLLQSKELKGVGDVKSALTLDMEIQNVKSGLLVFSDALV